MISVYAMQELGERMTRKLRDALRILSGMQPSTAPESQETEEDMPSQSGVDEPDTPPNTQRRLSSNQRGRYGRH